MGRNINENRKRNHLIIRSFTACQRNYLKEKAEIESAQSGRVISLSEITAKLIYQAMKQDGYICHP